MNFMPGWEPGLIIAAGQQGTTVSFFNSSVSNASTITIPNGVQAGDLIIIAHSGSDDDGTPPANVTPSGFTQAVTASDNQASKFSWRHSVHYKLAIGTEGGTSVNVIQGNDSYNNPDQQSVCMVFRRSPAASAITLQAAESDVDGSNEANVKSIPSSAGAVPIVVIGTIHGNVDSSDLDAADISLSPTQDGRIPSGADASDNLTIAVYKIYNSAPADVTLVESANYYALASMYFELS